MLAYLFRALDGEGWEKSHVSEITGGCGVSSNSGLVTLDRGLLLRTKSRQEKIFSDKSVGLGVGCFLPLVTCNVFMQGARRWSSCPCSRYLFLRGSLDDAYSADRKKRVCQIITVHNQRQIDEELTNLHMALFVNSTLIPSPI